MSWTQGGLQFRLPMFALNVGFCAMETSIGKAGTGCLATQASGDTRLVTINELEGLSILFCLTMCRGTWEQWLKLPRITLRCQGQVLLLRLPGDPVTATNKETRTMMYCTKHIKAHQSTELHTISINFIHYISLQHLTGLTVSHCVSLCLNVSHCVSLIFVDSHCFFVPFYALASARLCLRRRQSDLLMWLCLAFLARLAGELCQLCQLCLSQMTCSLFWPLVGMGMVQYCTRKVKSSYSSCSLSYAGMALNSSNVSATRLPVLRQSQVHLSATLAYHLKCKMQNKKDLAEQI